MVPITEKATAAIFLGLMGSENTNLAMIVTKIGALLWITVATEAPKRTTEVFHKTWNNPMLITPIAISQGRFSRLMLNNPGRNNRIKMIKTTEVVRSRQNAKLTAEILLSWTIKLINILDVAQYKAANTTKLMPLE